MKGNDAMDIGIILTTFQRNDNLELFFKSARKIYGNIPIYIADQNPSRLKRRIIKKYNAINITVKYDCGLSAARNALVNAAKHKYLILAEDDFVFNDKSKADNAIKILENNKTIAMVGGRYHNVYRTRNGYKELNYFNYEYMLDLSNFGTLLLTHRTQLDSDKHRNLFHGIEHFTYDTVNNFFIMNRDTMIDNNLFWDEKIKVEAEHIDFFLNLKINHPELKSVFLPTLEVDHVRKISNRKYKKYRTRTEFFYMFAKKWKIRSIINQGNWVRDISKEKQSKLNLKNNRPEKV